jgi:cytochrome c551/c552
MKLIHHREEKMIKNNRKESRMNVFLKVCIGLLMISCTIPPIFAQGKDAYPLPQNPLKGANIFFKKGCIECHKVWGIGNTFGPDLTRIGMEKDFFKLTGALWSHSPKMIDVMEERGIERPVFSADEIESLLAYMYYLGLIDELGDYLRGEEIYSNKGCSRCHSLGGDQDMAGPNLDKYGRYVSPVYIATALWNHSATVSQAMLNQSFAPREMCHLLAFIKGNAANPEGKTVYIQPGSPWKGQKVFMEKRCASCHSEQNLDLQESDLQKSLTEIVGMMWNHSSSMWQEMKSRNLTIPRFDVGEMSDLTAYLYFISFYGKKGNPSRGEVIFKQKGCFSCHNQEAIEAGKGIDLKDIPRSSFLELISLMWNHAPEMEKMVTEMNLVWPSFEKNEMKDLISYIQSIK